MSLSLSIYIYIYIYTYIYVIRRSNITELFDSPEAFGQQDSESDSEQLRSIIRYTYISL